jgi:hypothetical protein
MLEFEMKSQITKGLDFSSSRVIARTLDEIPLEKILADLPKVKSLLLVGSFALGIPRPSSDIDLIAIGEDTLSREGFIDSIGRRYSLDMIPDTSFCALKNLKEIPADFLKTAGRLRTSAPLFISKSHIIILKHLRELNVEPKILQRHWSFVRSYICRFEEDAVSDSPEFLLQRAKDACLLAYCLESPILLQKTGTLFAWTSTYGEQWLKELVLRSDGRTKNALRSALEIVWAARRKACFDPCIRPITATGKAFMYAGDYLDDALVRWSVGLESEAMSIARAGLSIAFFASEGTPLASVGQFRTWVRNLNVSEAMEAATLSLLAPPLKQGETHQLLDMLSMHMRRSLINFD